MHNERPREGRARKLARPDAQICYLAAWRYKRRHAWLALQAPACLQALQKCGSCALTDLQRLHVCGRVARIEFGSRIRPIFNRLAKVLLLTQYDVSMHRTLTTSSKGEHSVLLKSVCKLASRVRRHVRGLPTRSPGISCISNLLRSWCMTGLTSSRLAA